jgi:Fe-S-cluster-containing hydrogenase component 2
MLGMNYGPDSDPLATLARPEVGTVSVYARNRDYHDIIKGRLKQLAQKLASRTGAEVKVFVDTAPLMEKPLAQAAGIGWQGKHTVLISRDLGNWLFLGSILTTLELPPDESETDHCGSCTRCLTACPTDAFPAPFVLDSRRCISYLTIEHKGPIDRALRPLMGNRIYGCDDCQLACPWNRYAQAAEAPDFRVRNGLDAASLAELFAWSEADFETRLAGSASASPATAASSVPSKDMASVSALATARRLRNAGSTDGDSSSARKRPRRRWSCLMKTSRSLACPNGLYLRLKRSKRWNVTLPACMSSVSMLRSYAVSLIDLNTCSSVRNAPSRLITTSLPQCLSLLLMKRRRCFCKGGARRRHGEQ